MMKYDPETETIVPAFKDDGSKELYSLRVEYPKMNGGDTIIANAPTLSGGEYILTYTLLKAGSPEQLAYLETL